MAAAATAAKSAKADEALCVLKFLAPEALASAIIGRGGATISAMRTSCQAKKIGMTERGQYYPGTDCRVLTVQASTSSSLDQVTEKLVEKVMELATGGGTPDASLRDAVGTADDLRLRVLMPRSAVGGLIGRQGESIKKLQEATGARISVENATYMQPSSEQVVTVSNTNKDNLITVMKEVNKQVQLLNGEAWFATWAASTGVDSLGLGSLSTLSRGGGGGSASYSHSPGVDLLTRVATSLPPYVTEFKRGFVITCIVPSWIVGGLIGRKGSGTREVQAITNTEISIRDIESDKDNNKSLTILGLLPNACAAYMLMMKRYVDAEGAQQ